MSLRPFFAKLLGPSAILLLFATTGAGCGGCTDESTVTCDANGENCMICDAFGCHPANPSIGSGGAGGQGGMGQGGSGGSGPCDPNVTTCGCAVNEDCPSGTICLDGLCLVGCNYSYECGPGKVCANGKCETGCDVQSPCDKGYVCDKGICIPDPKTACPQMPCAAGEACVNGVCEPACTKNADCPAGDICDSTSGGCIPDPSPKPGCGPNKACPGTAKCGDDGYCHYPCTTLTDCKLIDSRFFACDASICKTEEEVSPECSLDKPCPAGQDCISNKCL